MSPQTLQALEQHHRRQFCKACLKDLKEESYQANPDDENQVDEFVGISSRLEAKGLSSESIQYRYFMLFLIIGSSFLQNQGIHHHLLNCKTEEACNEYLEELIDVNLRGQKAR